MTELNNREELERRIRMLEKENEQISQRSEDTLMLGLVSESIGQATSVDMMLEVAIERISMLKDIPMVACCVLEQKNMRVLKSYLSFCHEDLNGDILPLPPIKDMETCLCSAEHAWVEALSHANIHFSPHQVLLIPFASHSIARGVYIFADMEEGPNHLNISATMLERVTDLLTISMDNHYLLERYQHLNSELDRRVVERSKALAESEEKYRVLVERSDAAIMLFSEGHFEDCNAATLAMFRCDSKEEFLSFHPGILSADLQANGVSSMELSDRYLNHAVEHGSCRFDWIHKRLDGEEFPADVQLTRIDVAGKVMVQGVVIDVTERVKVEQELRKFSQAIEQTSESILITDISGSIEYVNAAFSTMTGYSKEYVLGKHPQLLHEENDSYCGKLWNARASSACSETMFYDRRKDGTIHPMLMSVAPILNDAGEIKHHVCIQRDMTELKQLEEKFYHAQKMESIGTLVGGLAHDFNNMLASMTGSMYLLKTNLADQPEFVRNIESMEDQVFRSADMIKQLLLFSRKGHVDMLLLSFVPLMQEVFTLTRRTVPENIPIHFNCTDTVMKIKGDASLLQQVFMNLVNNARDALAEIKEPRIDVNVSMFEADEVFMRKHSEATDRYYACLSVQDNGSGISEYDMEQIFEPYFTTKDKDTGTGLGLAMIFGAIESHGGFIDVVSHVGKGAMFSVYLPLQEDVIEVQEDEEVDGLAVGHGEAILVVDDEKMIREVNVALLKNIGYAVYGAQDGKEALEVYSQHKNEIKLILTDVVMPRMSGVELAHALWADEPDLPVIFISGYDGNQLAGLPKGKMHAVILQKPCDIDVLSHHIQNLLAKKAPAAE